MITMRGKTTALLMALLVAISAVGLASAEVVVMDDAPTVLEDENDRVTAEVEWNETMTDPTSETATVTVYNKSEYDNDTISKENVTVAYETTIDATENGTTSTSFDAATSGIELDTEYHVEVEADDAEADSATIMTPGNYGGGAFFTGGSSSTGLVVVLVVAAGALVLRGDD